MEQEKFALEVGSAARKASDTMTALLQALMLAQGWHP